MEAQLRYLERLGEKGQVCSGERDVEDGRAFLDRMRNAEQRGQRTSASAFQRFSLKIKVLPLPLREGVGGRGPANSVDILTPRPAPTAPQEEIP